jgi:hypothetical protein
MWCVIYKADRVSRTYHKTFRHRQDAKNWMLEYIEYGGTGALLCRATEGYGNLLYSDDSLPIELMADDQLEEVLEDMLSKEQGNTQCKQITTLSQNTHRNMESVKQ